MIIAIIGGLGTGKTLLNAYLTYNDLCDGRKVFTNIKFAESVEKRFKDKINYLNAEKIENMLDDLHNKKIDLRNSTISIQEMHNFLDSRKSSFSKSLFSYFILQSRHASPPSYDKKLKKMVKNPMTIIFDTQQLHQVDRRLRNNVNVIFSPNIKERDPDGKPLSIRANIIGFFGQNIQDGSIDFDVSGIPDIYNSWQIVDFSQQGVKPKTWRKR